MGKGMPLGEDPERAGRGQEPGLGGQFCTGTENLRSQGGSSAQLPPVWETRSQVGSFPDLPVPLLAWVACPGWVPLEAPLPCLSQLRLL